MRGLAPPAARERRAGRGQEKRLLDREEAWLGPVAIAVWVEIGWMLEWPLALNRIGIRACRNGYGRDRLPIVVERRAGGAYCWEGRRAEL